MKNTMIGILVFILGVAVFLAAANGITGKNREKQCREYEQLLGGHTYTGHDSVTTARHGKVSYDYEMELSKDGTCVIHFSATRTEDNSRFPENGTTAFDLTGMTWSVQYHEGHFALQLSGGDWDWQGWSAAAIDRSIQILDSDGSLTLKAIRSGYYEFLFLKRD